MARPALSATRALEIIDLMSQSPGQSFSLSELVRRTGANVASCHAILNALRSGGYVTRHPAHRTYRLGSKLVGIGQAVLGGDALLGHAMAATEQLASRTGLEVVLTARTGDSIMGLARASGSPRLRASMRPGRRVPLRPPLGATFFAWADDADVEAWLASGAADDAEPNRAALALVRQRGFLVTLQSTEQSELKRVFAAGSNPPDTKPQDIAEVLSALQHALYQPPTLEEDVAYPVDFISAPIFDFHDAATYALTLSGFDVGLSGREVVQHARQLLAACAEVMADREVQPERGRS